jgi:hypothetical protein
VCRENVSYFDLLAFWNNEFKHIQRGPAIVLVKFCTERFNGVVHKIKTSGGSPRTFPKVLT